MPFTDTIGAMSSYPVSDEWLRHKYWVEGLDCPSIGWILGRDASSVRRRLLHYGIPTRSRGGRKGIKFDPDRVANITVAQRKRRANEQPPAPLICEWCKAAFPRRWQFGVFQRFCSAACFQQVRQLTLQDPMIQKMATAMRNFIHRVGVNTKRLEGLQKYSENILGYTKHDLRAHLESLFTEGMSWSNYGGIAHGRFNTWVIDHKTPIAKLIKSGITDPEIINALSNLQPMWSKDNTRKRARVVES